MRLAGISVGDIVEVDKRGRRFHARVCGRNALVGNGLDLMPLDPTAVSYRHATAREIIGHYRKAKGSA